MYEREKDGSDNESDEEGDGKERGRVERVDEKRVVGDGVGGKGDEKDDDERGRRVEGSE
jgi:hypothetical protein